MKQDWWKQVVLEYIAGNEQEVMARLNRSRIRKFMVCLNGKCVYIPRSMMRDFVRENTP